MKKIDILIIYEHKTRELENSALISAELKRRGYTCRVLYMYPQIMRWNISAKVILVPHLYNDYQLDFFIRNKYQNNRCVIDLQYEQVLSKSSEDGCHNPEGQAMLAQHTAWGKAQVERYIHHGINPSNIYDVGCVSMDLLRPEFRDYFLTKAQIALRFGLDEKKEWVLFISSFSYAKRTKQSIEQLSKLNPDAKLFAKISDDSYNTILEWLYKAARNNPNKLFIYRKHPAELDDNTLHKFEKELPNFRSIDDFSMRQWAIVADKIYNWYSTSLADLYFVHKSCYILRPFEIPKEQEVSIMVGGKFITNYDSFAQTLNKKDNEFPVSAENVKYFYSNVDTGKMAYERIADLCEDMIRNPLMGVDYQLPFHKKKILSCIKNLYEIILFQYGKRVKTNMYVIKFFEHFPLLKNVAARLALYNKDLFQADKLMDDYYKRFCGILNKKEI